MECGRDGAAEEEDGVGMEAAQALAGMGGSGSVELSPVFTSQEQSAAATITSSPAMKLRRKLTVTEAEKEERKLRRVMANRESARQTIRRRQAMHLELSRKADHVLKENENLKKQKELMVEEYNSLEGRNECLTALLAKVNRAAAGEREKEEEPNSCPPIFVQDQPCFWPSTFHHPNIPCSSHSSRPGPPVFLLPIPWLLPLLTHSSSVESNQMVLKQNTREEACSGPGVLSHLGPREASRSCKVDDGADLRLAPAMENMRDGFDASTRKADDLFVAAEARRRRNELMKLKTCKYHSC